MVLPYQSRAMHCRRPEFLLLCMALILCSGRLSEAGGKAKERVVDAWPWVFQEINNRLSMAEDEAKRDLETILRGFGARQVERRALSAVLPS